MRLARLRVEMEFMTVMAGLMVRASDPNECKPGSAVGAVQNLHDILLRQFQCLILWTPIFARGTNNYTDFAKSEGLHALQGGSIALNIASQLFNFRILRHRPPSAKDFSSLM
jgi:hypothetical protein